MSRPIYQTPAWAAVRKRVLERDRYRCRIRLPGCKGAASAVDHIVELQDGGAEYDESNLQAACSACNTSKRNRRVARKARTGVREW